MARTSLTPQQVVTSGLEATYTAANVDGHMFAPGESRMLHVVNGGGSSINVTVQAEYTRDGLALPDRVVAVPNGEDRFIGPFDRETYAQRSGNDRGKVYVDFSAVTSVTVALLDVG